MRLRTSIGWICFAAAIVSRPHVSRGQERALLAPIAGADARFEVASIKANRAEGGGGISTQPGGRLLAKNVTLRRVITLAYLLQDYQLVGGPGWMNTDRFDITAAAPAERASLPAGIHGEMLSMIRHLLTERFKLVVHEDEREMDVYALVHARADRRLGPGLRPSEINCAGKETSRIPELLPGGRPVCAMRQSGGQWIGGGVAIESLPNLLAPIVGGPVLDRTGLTGRYDIDLSFSPEAAPAPAASVPAPTTDNVSVYTAVKEQLGLILQPQRGPVKVLVVDGLQQPTDN